MRQILKFLAALGIALVIIFAIRVFAFTVYTAPATIGNDIKAGSKVVVNKLNRCSNFKRGDIVVFTLSGEAPAFALVGPPQELGKITAMPGDTIKVRGMRYRIPLKCCTRCLCHDCCLYLVDTGSSRRLVHKHQMVGNVLRLKK